MGPAFWTTLDPLVLRALLLTVVLLACVCAYFIHVYRKRGKLVQIMKENEKGLRLEIKNHELEMEDQEKQSRGLYMVVARWALILSLPPTVRRQFGLVENMWPWGRVDERGVQLELPAMTDGIDITSRPKIAAPKR
ncbi:MAG: hypothetical protein WB760_21250 [Xanthobacteraceae bacterium]